MSSQKTSKRLKQFCSADKQLKGKSKCEKKTSWMEIIILHSS